MSCERTAAPSFEHRSERDLPEGWAYAALASLGRWGTGNTPSKANAAYWANGTVPWVSPKDMKAPYLDDAIDHVTERAVTVGGAAVVPPGTVFFVVRGMILAHTFPVAIVTKRAAFNQDMRSLLPHPGLHGPYLLRALEREAPAILGVVREATHGTLRLESDTLLPWPIPIAPISEQRRIIEKVEALLADVNRAKERLDRVPLILKRFRQAVLAAACSGELTREWRAHHSCRESADELQRRIWQARQQRFAQGGPDRPRTGTLAARPIESQPDVFELPATWRWSQWDDLCDWITYGFTRPMPHVEEGVPIVTARHVSGSRIEFASTDRTTRTAFEDLSEKDRPRPGEVLLTKDGSIGRAALVDIATPFCINQSVAVLRFGGLSADPRYLVRAIECPWTQHLIDEGAKGSAIRHIAITAFGRCPVPLPPLAEQAEIVRQVERLFAVADAIERRVKAATARAGKLPQAILSKAFSGELVPTEAELARVEGRTYENAEELLARVRHDGSGDTLGTPTRANGRGQFRSRRGARSRRP